MLTTNPFRKIANAIQKEQEKTLFVEGETNHLKGRYSRKKYSDKIRVVHVALEYGSPNKSICGVGGIGSFLESLVVAQNKTRYLESVVILPYYKELLKNFTKSFVISVTHYYKGKDYNSKVHKIVMDKTPIYLIEAHPELSFLFDEVKMAPHIYNQKTIIEKSAYFSSAVASFLSNYPNSINPEIIQVHSPVLSLLIAKLKQYQNSIHKLGYKTIYTAHSSHRLECIYHYDEIPDIGIVIPSLSVCLRTLVENNADEVVYVSHYLQNDILPLYNKKKSHETCILNGINPPEEKMVEEKKAYLDKINKILVNNKDLKNKKLNENALTALYLGRFSGEKGVSVLNDALLCAVRNNINLIIAGKHSQISVKSLEKQHKHLPNVVTLYDNNYDQKMDELIRCAADIYLVPSKEEACGLVAMEAGLYGGLVIARKTGGLKEVIKENANGIFFNEDTDFKLIFNNAIKTLQEARELNNLKEIQKAIAFSANKTFDINQYCQPAYLKLYRKILRTPLITQEISVLDAILKATLEDLKEAIEWGGNIDELGEYNITPLMLAAERGNLVAVKYLVENGADIEKRSMDGNRAIDVASKNGRLSIEKYLYQKELYFNQILIPKKKILNPPFYKEGSIKVLHVTYEYFYMPYGGITTFISSLNKAMASHHQSVSMRVITPYYNSIETGQNQYSIQKIQTLRHRFKNEYIQSEIYCFIQEGIIHYLVKPLQYTHLFENVSYINKESIYDNLHEKAAYFCSAVAAFSVVLQDTPHQIDILNCHSWGTALIAKIIQRRYKLLDQLKTPKIILTIHSSLKEQGLCTKEVLPDCGVSFDKDEISLLKEGISNSEKIVFVSKALMREALNEPIPHYPLHELIQMLDREGKTQIILNNIGQDFDPLINFNHLSSSQFKMNFINIKKSLKGELGKYFDKSLRFPLVLFVGRFLEEKGIDKIEEAIKIVLERNGSFICMGMSGNDKSAEFMNDLINKYQAEAQVLFITDMQTQNKYGKDIRLAADITFIPSRLEACGLVSMEAQLNANYILASKVGGLQDTVFEGVNGYFFDYCDSKTIGPSLDKILLLIEQKNQNQDLENALSDISNFARNYYVWSSDSINNSLTAYKQLFEDVTQEKKSDLISTTNKELWRDLVKFPRKEFSLSSSVFKIENIYISIDRNYQTIKGFFSTIKKGVIFKAPNSSLCEKEVAIKSVENKMLHAKAMMRNEKNILRILKRNVTDGLMTRQGKQHLKFYLVMPWYSGKTLDEMISINLPTESKYKIIRNLLLQINELHQKNILHCDIHGKNFIINKNNHYSATLIDFAFSKVLPFNVDGIPNADLPERAPQESFNGFYSKRTDIYCIGILMVQLFASELGIDVNAFLNGGPKGTDENDKRYQILNSSLAPGVNPLIKSFLLWLIEKNYKYRPSASIAIEVFDRILLDSYAGLFFEQRIKTIKMLNDFKVKFNFLGNKYNTRNDQGHSLITKLADSTTKLPIAERLSLIQWIIDYENLPIETILNEGNQFGNTALHIALEHKETSLVDWLMANNSLISNRNNDGQTCDEYARVFNNQSLIEPYIEKLKENINQYSLLSLIKANRLDEVYVYLKNPSLNIQDRLNLLDEDNYTALDYACKLQNYSMISLLIRHGARKNINNDYADLIIFLHSNGFVRDDVNQIHPKNLHLPTTLAVQNNNLSALKLLFQFNADLNKTNDLGNTPYLIAVDKNHMEIKEWLETKGVNLDCSNDIGFNIGQLIKNNRV
ncbi:MAG: uncharacterized protein JWM09_851 [Francisellaceae bacterium]|nr:uncharacterized protein [Francisellaceae bacterium]